jgi:hypothetical protein
MAEYGLKKGKKQKSCFELTPLIKKNYHKISCR